MLSTEFHHHACIARLAYKDLDKEVRKEWKALGFTSVKRMSLVTKTESL
jgi:hypothetical protein